MNGQRVSTVNAYTAHREWARRPPDERYASVQQLFDASCTRRSRTEERIIETVRLHVRAEDSDTLVLDKRVGDGDSSDLTHWSFEQLAGIAGAPPNYLRTLPATIAADAINYGLQGCNRGEQQLYADATKPWTLHAITSSRYARPPRRAGQARAPSHGRTSVLPTTARIQGRRLGCRTRPFRRLPGRPRHVPVPRGR